MIQRLFTYADQVLLWSVFLCLFIAVFNPLQKGVDLLTDSYTMQGIVLTLTLYFTLLQHDMGTAICNRVFSVRVNETEPFETEYFRNAMMRQSLFESEYFPTELMRQSLFERVAKSFRNS